MKKLVLMITTAILMSTFTGCSNLYEVPVNLMKTPKLNSEYIKNQKDLTDSELRVLLQSFMPEGYKLLEDNKSMEKQSIYDLDVDGDKKNEYVVLVRNSNKTNVGFFVVKSKYGKWDKVFEWLDEGIGIKTVKAIRGLNEKDTRFLIGNMINTKGPSEYYLFDFNENWDGDNVDLGTWSDLSIVQSTEGNINFIAENRDDSKILDFYSISYDGEKFNHNDSADTYQNKINEYNSMINEYEGNESAWYYYIYAKSMAGHYEDALKDMNEYLARDKSRDSITVNEAKFQILKAMILAKLDRGKEAQEIIDKYEIDFKNPEGSINNDAGLGDSEVLINNETNFRNSEIIVSNDVNAYEFYYTAGVVSKTLKNAEMADYNFKNALDRLEKTYDKRLKGSQEIISEVMESLIKDSMN